MKKTQRKKTKAIQDHDILAKMDLFTDLTEEELLDIHKIARRVEVKVGEVILREGELGDSMFLFAQGEVAVTKNLTLKTGKKGFSQAEKSMVRLDAQFVSFFGDMALIENDVRSATITASTDCLMYEVRREDFERITGQNPALGFKVIRKIAAVLCHRVRQGNQDVLKLTTALSIALSK